jgi:hypothetical protein
MSESRRIADAIIRTVTGPMWHGPALSEVLHGVSAEEAAARAGSAHTIWELVLHVIAWVDISHERLAGNPRKNVSVDDDWPTPPAPSGDAWGAAVARLADRHRSLAASVEVLGDDVLRSKVVGHDYGVRVMLNGVVEHGTYHGGQIAILKKLVVPADPSLRSG